MFHKLKAFFNRSEFLKNVAILASGGMLAQVIPVAISPVLSRLYSPESFGAFAFYASIAALFSLVATGRYDLAIPLPQEDRDGYALCIAAFRVTLIVTAATLVLLIPSTSWLARTFKISGPSAVLLLVPVTVLLTGIFNIANYWALRQKRFKLLSLVKVAQSGAQAAGNAGLFALGPFGLVLGQIAGFLTADLLLSRSFTKRYRTDDRRISRNLKEFSQFPKYSVPNVFVDSLRVNGIVFLISYFFNAVSLGAYYFTMKVLNTPSALLGGSISQVYYQKAALSHRKGTGLHGITVKLLVRLSVLVLPVFLILFLFGPPIFGLVFGQRWRIAGVFASVLSPYLYLSFLASALSQIPAVLRRQRAMLGFSVVGNSLMVLTFLYGGLLAHDLLKGFVVLSIVMSGYFTVLIAWFLSLTNRYDRQRIAR